MGLRNSNRPRLVTPLFLLVMASTFGYFVSIGALVPVLPRYVEGPLGGTNQSVGLVIGAFAVTAVLLRPWTGRFSDRRGRRVLVILGAAIAGVSTLGYIWADSLWLLIVLRLLSGIGEAFFYTGAASVINDLAPDERRGEALSYFSLALFGGMAVGPIAGEALLHASGFDSVWILAAVAAGAAALLGIPLPDTRPKVEERTVGRLLHRAAVLPGVVLAANIWGLATFLSFVPLYVFTIGMEGSRGVFAMHSLLVFAIRMFGARIPDKLGPARSGRAALTLVAIGLVIVGAWAEPIGLYVGIVVYSIGHSLAFPALMTLALNSAPAGERGAVIGTFTAFFDASFGVGAISSGYIAEALGYRGAFISAGGVAVAGLFLLASRTRRAAAREALAGEAPA